MRNRPASRRSPDPDPWRVLPGRPTRPAGRASSSTLQDAGSTGTVRVVQPECASILGMTGQQLDRPVIGLLDDRLATPTWTSPSGLPCSSWRPEPAARSCCGSTVRGRPLRSADGTPQLRASAGRPRPVRTSSYPVRRGAGGRAVAYHGGALCIDHVSPHTPELGSIRRRFAVFGDLLARTLRALGVAAAVGEVPGEYCPGEFSVNDGRGHKLVGTAQRLVPRTWLFSAVILISDPDPLRAVLEAVYAELELDWDPGDSW